MNEKEKMSDEKKIATLTIEGKDYPLAWDFNALAVTEQMLPGRANLLTACMNLGDLSATELLGLTFAAILGGDPTSKLKPSQVGAMIRLDTMPSILDALGDAYAASLPAEPEAAAVIPEGGSEILPEAAGEFNPAVPVGV